MLINVDITLQLQHKSNYSKWNLTNLGKNKDKKQSNFTNDKGEMFVEVERLTSHTLHNENENILQKQILTPEAEVMEYFCLKKV